MPSTNHELDLIFLIDRSGSMYGFETDTIGGFNSFVEKERKKDFDTKVTTILFSDNYNVLYKRKSINEVCELTSKEYYVGGCTALLDAIGKTITDLNREIDNNVLFVIMIDGYENASKEYSKFQIKNMISNHNWEFIFIGADIDSFSEARNLGINESRVANYKKSEEGIDRLYCSVSDAVDCMHKNISLDDAEWKRNLKEYD